jgi:hypothetical protein
MTTSAFSFSIRTLLAAGMILAWGGAARADGRAGAVEWSDGRKLAGAISLTPGKDLRLLANDRQFSLSLDEVKEIRFKPEKEEMREGYYFPDAGQATQAKTGEVYPVRYLQTEITLADGKVIGGHLLTTTFYVETGSDATGDAATEKVVLMAKQTGADGQKLADLVYPTAIRFDADAATAGFSRIDLTQAGFVPLHAPVIVARPDLTLLSAQQDGGGKPAWTVPAGDPAQIFFAAEAGDGIHVAWPATEADPATRQAVEAGLTTLRDFYDTRTLLGCSADVDAGDVYSLVMLKRVGKSVDGGGTALSAGTVPWSLVILRWKYDPDQKKVTLLNRALLVIGREEPNSPAPAVLREPGLLKDIAVGK